MADPQLPSSAGRFKFSVGGVEIGTFIEVSGLQVERQVEEVPEGGRKGVLRFPGGLSHPNVVLKRGVTNDDALLGWLRETQDALDGGGRFTKQTGSVELLDAKGDTVRAWTFSEAFPVRWAGPTLAVSSNEVATEELEIAHDGFW